MVRFILLLLLIGCDLEPPEKEKLKNEAEEVRNRIKKSENNPTK